LQKCEVLKGRSSCAVEASYFVIRAGFSRRHEPDQQSSYCDLGVAAGVAVLGLDPDEEVLELSVAGLVVFFL
jgi:hypothetical protein